MTLPAITHSYSSLSQFDNCPEAMRQLFITRRFKKTWTVDGGIDAHTVLEARLKKKTPLPPELAEAEAFCASLEADGRPVECEVKFAVTHHITPTTFFHPDAWLRGKFDIVKRDRDKRKAFIGDWKTGKRRESDEQLAIGADLLFENDPDIDTVTGVNLWLNAGGVGQPYVFTRATKSKRWAPLIKRLREIELLDPAKEWEKRDGPLCRYCPVKTCENYQGA
jgi:hypothetical protein